VEIRGRHVLHFTSTGPKQENKNKNKKIA